MKISKISTFFCFDRVDVQQYGFLLNGICAREKLCKESPKTRSVVRKFNKDWVFVPNKISGVGTIFGLLVHVLPEPNKQRA